MQTKRICLWSGPRNVSTALMYAFAQRSDTHVIDEPLYAHYLHNTDRATAHPGIAAVMASMSTDGEARDTRGDPRSLRETCAFHETDGAPPRQH